MIWQFSELGNYDSTKSSNGGNNTDPKIVRWNLLDQPARKGLYDTYRELIAVRTNNPQLFGKDADVTVECAESNWAQGRKIVLRNGNDEIYLFVNPTTANASFSASFSRRDNTAYHILTKSYNTDPSFNAISGSVTIPANSFVVIGTTNLQGVDEISIDDNADAEIRYYDLQGRRIKGDRLIPGIYVKVQGATAEKVMIR